MFFGPLHTQNNSDVDDDTVTIVTSNWTKRLHVSTTMLASARALLGNPLLQLFNAFIIATNQAITNTGATSIFTMEGSNVDSKYIN
jgi:hypothetical protein